MTLPFSGASCHPRTISYVDRARLVSENQVSAFGAAHSGEPLGSPTELTKLTRGHALREREAWPLIYYYHSPVSQRLTAMCGAKGALKDLDG